MARSRLMSLLRHTAYQQSLLFTLFLREVALISLLMVLAPLELTLTTFKYK